MKKLLLISYYFPPCGGAPVQRWLRLLPHLIQRGYEITVITTRDGDYPFIDESLMAQIPPSVRVVRTSVWTTGKLWKLVFGPGKRQPYGNLSEPGMGLLMRALVWIRINLIIPDIRIIWNPSAYRAALREIRTRAYDAVITTGPPHSTHLVGMKLKKQHGLRWIADFRDPLSEIHYLKLARPVALTRLLYRALERRIMHNTDLLLTVSENIKDKLPTGNKMVLYNAYDPQDFQQLEYVAAREFRIKYVGQITAGQDFNLLRSFARRIVELPGYVLSFIGTRLSSAELELLNPTQSTQIKAVGFVSHQEAVKELVHAEALLLIVNDTAGSAGILTTKLFEYLASGTPILCFSPVHGEAAQVIEDSNAGKVFTYKQMDEAFVWLTRLQPGTKNTDKIDSYSVVHQADKLSDAITGLFCD